MTGIYNVGECIVSLFVLRWGGGGSLGVPGLACFSGGRVGVWGAFGILGLGTVLMFPGILILQLHKNTMIINNTASFHLR